MQKPHRFFVALLFFVTAFCGCQKSSNEPFFENMVGKWQIDGRQIVETWQKVNKSDTLYTAQVVESFSGKYFLREEISITRKDRQIYYNAKIKHQDAGASVPFKMTEVSDTKAVFENPAHNYPQKITYELKDNYKTLVTEISGSMDGQPQSFSFTHHQKK